eukprot:IDg1929t1
MVQKNECLQAAYEFAVELVLKDSLTLRNAVRETQTAKFITIHQAT